MMRWKRSLHLPITISRWIEEVRIALHLWAQRSRRLHTACLAWSHARRRLPVRLALEGLEERMLLSANTDGLGLPNLASDLRQFRNDLTMAAVSLVNTAQPGQTPTATTSQWHEAWNTLATDANKVWQGFVQAEFAALGAIREEFDSLLIGLGLKQSVQPPSLPPRSANNIVSPPSDRSGGEDPNSATGRNSSATQSTIKPLATTGNTVQFQTSLYRTGESASTVIAVTLEHPDEQTITVQYATSDGTAKAGKDYVAASGTLTFTPDIATQYITVQTLDDNAVNEPSQETMYLTLSNPVNATLGNPSTTELDIQEDGDGGSGLPPPTVAPPCSNDG